jgi:hypothetical protein
MYARKVCPFIAPLIIMVATISVDGANEHQRSPVRQGDMADKAHRTRAPAVGSYHSDVDRLTAVSSQIPGVHDQKSPARVCSAAAPEPRRRARALALVGFLTVMSWRTKKRESAHLGWLGCGALAARKPSHSASNPAGPRSERKFARLSHITKHGKLTSVNLIIGRSPPSDARRVLSIGWEARLAPTTGGRP